MKFYCASCNRLEEIESSIEGKDRVCDQCGYNLTALRETPKPVSPAPLRIGLIFLIGGTVFLLGILWLLGGDLSERASELGLGGAFGDDAIAFLSMLVATVKIGLSIIIVSCALFIGTKMAPPRHQVSQATSGVKQPPETKSTRHGVRIVSSVGATVGTLVIVLVIGLLTIIALAILYPVYYFLFGA